jgi:drug/metabolite transporter (DMT)-like permease
MGVWGAWRGLFKMRFTVRQHVFAALMGFLLFFLNYWMFYEGTKELTSGLVAVCYSTIVIMNAFNQWLILGIPVRRPVIIGGAIGLIGIGLVFEHEIQTLDFTSIALQSLLLCIAAAYVASLGNIASLRNSRDHMPVFQSTCYGMAWGALASFIAAAMMGKPFIFDMSFNYIWSLLYLAVPGSIIAFVAYLTLTERIGADKAAYTSVLIPIIALLISTWFEHYVWTMPAIAGVVLVIIGNVIALRKSI